MPFRLFVAILALSAATLGITWPDTHRSPPDAPQSSQSRLVAVRVPAAPYVDWDEQYELEQARQVAAYLAAIHEAELAAFYAGVQAELDRQAARAVRPVARPSVGSTVGACTGFVIPDYIIQRESGGNPSAYNPSGAYGCAQTLLSHYSGGGTCAGLNPYTIEGQRECVYRLSSGGTNLQPWATTR